jgi:hypothetical protein
MSHPPINHLAVMLEYMMIYYYDVEHGLTDILITHGVLIFLQVPDWHHEPTYVRSRPSSD